MADNTIANAIKFLKGEEKSLPATKTEGQVYFAYKNVGTAEKPSYTGAIYIDTPIGGTQTRVKMTANADVADKAFNDSAGLNIRETYLSSLGYTDDGKQTILIKGSGNNQTRIALPIASTTKSGIVTTDAQSFGGTKTFATINSTNLTVTGSSGFNYSGIETATESKARPVWFADSSGNGKPVVNTNFTYNPATQTLSVANLSGTADKANKDNAGYDIRSTYISNITVNGTTLTFTKGSGATSSITLQDNNNAVTQTAIKSSDYTNWRTVLWGASNGATEGFAPTTVTDGAFTSDTLIFQPSSGTLKAKIFKGSLSGNASTATTASKAINDGSNQNIANTYVKYKSIKFNATADKVYLLEGNGAGSVTATSGSNISTAIIPAATDKAAGVITTDTQTFSGEKIFNNNVYIRQALIGNNLIDGCDSSKFIIIPKVPYSMIDSTHNTDTYFKALLKWICQKYPNMINYTFVGLANPNVNGKVSIHIYNTSDVKDGYPQYSAGFFHSLFGTFIAFGTTEYNFYYRESLMTDNNYAGSASSGGAATSANKLNTNAGSLTQPIYFKDGIPVSTTYTLNAHVQGVFGDLSTGGWKKINGNVGGSYITTAYNNKAAAWNSQQYSASIVFGAQDTKGLLDCGYNTPIVTFGGASNSGSTDDNPKWYFKLFGTSGQIYTFPTTSKTLAANDGSNASGSWGISITGNANTATTATNADKLDGYHGSSSQAVGTYVLRDGSGYIYTNYINSNTSNSENPSISQIIVTNSSDNFYRKASLSHLKSSLGSMPASDVYAWAKASSKPSYSWDEITNKPSSFNPSSHTHPYLPLAGGTMTGTINFTVNKLACNFRSESDSSSYRSGVMHQSNGNEALVFAAANAVTSFIFKCGQDPVGMTSSTWTGITPSMQIKKQSVYINSLIANNVTPGYNLYVNGSTCCHGTLGVGNGSGSAEIDFFPISSSTVGARIKAYSDRIEFVFS